jgi:hypothetical protein
VDGLFLLAPGLDDGDHPWPISIPYLQEPVPLCHWHSLVVGDQRVIESPPNPSSASIA